MRAAIESGGVLLVQTNTPTPSPRVSGAPFLGPRVELTVSLGRRLSLLLGGFAGAALVRDAAGVRPGGESELDLGVGWTL